MIGFGKRGIDRRMGKAKVGITVMRIWDALVGPLAGAMVKALVLTIGVDRGSGSDTGGRGHGVGRNGRKRRRSGVLITPVVGGVGVR